MTDVPEGTLGFRVAGDVKRRDYDDVLVPALRGAVESGTGLHLRDRTPDVGERGPELDLELERIERRRLVAERGCDYAPHDFRHSWVTHLRAAGIDPADLAVLAGHTVETATARYTHALGRPTSGFGPTFGCAPRLSGGLLSRGSQVRVLPGALRLSLAPPHSSGRKLIPSSVR
jgi:hypothetical protein